MFEYSTSFRKFQQRQEEIQYRIGWLEALLKEAQLKLQSTYEGDQLPEKDLADYPVVGNILNFLEDTSELFQSDESLELLAASGSEEVQHFQNRLWNQIAWIQKLLANSQVELNQVSEILKNIT